MYQQLSKGENIFLSFTALGEAFGRIINGRANLVLEGTFLCTVGLIYGGVHLAPWDNHFKTTFERIAWKVCSCVTAAAVLGFVLQLCIGALIKFIDYDTPPEEEQEQEEDTQQLPADVEEKQETPSRKQTTSSTAPAKTNPRRTRVKTFKRKRDKMYWRIYKLLVGSTFSLGLIIVIFARCFLMVESFIALREQPDGVYNTVNWIESIPHLS